MLIDFVPNPPVVAGQTIRIRFRLEERSEEAGTHGNPYRLEVLNEDDDNLLKGDDQTYPWTDQSTVIERLVTFNKPGRYRVRHIPTGAMLPVQDYEFEVLSSEIGMHEGVSKVSLVPAEEAFSVQKRLWDYIDTTSISLGFESFVQWFQDERPPIVHGVRGLGADGGPDNPAYGLPTYEHLHNLSTRFITTKALGNGKDGSELSYVTGRSEKAGKDSYPDDIRTDNFPLKTVPFVELIYVYWLEEAMLFQSLNRIIARFRNRRIDRTSDPLARLTVSPLLPLRGLLWGLSEAERDRLSVHRRDDEYGYEYGLKLIGRAVPPSEQAVERRTQFLPAFHTLLNAAHHYYKERDDLTIQADAFPLLNGLRELHLVLAQGANNQFADLPMTARSETIEVQWMLAQPEMQQFLGGRTMVPYPEEWMDRVDTMKSLYGWSDVSVTHFFDLAVQGERLILSVRHGDWYDTMRNKIGGGDAENWAMHWRNSVQRYIHAYRAVTGVDLAQRVDTTMPSTLLSRRLAQQLV